MNPVVETFGEFSKKLTATDLMLYAGVAMVLWVLFKDKLGGVTSLVKGLLSNTKLVNAVPRIVASKPVADPDLFFELISSWKKTRDLAVRSGCVKAVDAVDQLFPYLSPSACKENQNEAAQLGK